MNELSPYSKTLRAWNTMPMCQPQTDIIEGTSKTRFEVVHVPSGWIVTRERLDPEDPLRVLYSSSVFVFEPG